MINDDGGPEGHRGVLGRTVKEKYEEGQQSIGGVISGWSVKIQPVAGAYLRLVQTLTTDGFDSAHVLKSGRAKISLRKRTIVLTLVGSMLA